MYYSNLIIENLCPHGIRLLRPDCVVRKRNGDGIIDSETNIEEKTILNIPPCNHPLTALEDPLRTCGQVAGINVTADTMLRFDQLIANLPKSDIIVVSKICALSLLQGVLGGNRLNGQFVDMFDLDRFYVPENRVFVKRGDGSYRVVGALGLKKVTPVITYDNYARRLQQIYYSQMTGNIIIAPVSAASAYLSVMEAKNLCGNQIPYGPDMAQVIEYLRLKGITEF